jgi:class 3 adenylate cyclase
VPTIGDSTDGPGSGTDVRTFLIADVRGYTKYTQDGDEAAAMLASRFADLVREVVEARQGFFCRSFEETKGWWCSCPPGRRPAGS